MPRDEAEAAYFTLLRAREEVDALQRYADFLAEERRRIRRFVSEGAALADTVLARHRRALRASDEPIRKALDARLDIIDDELDRMGGRLEAAVAFVEECEREHLRLKG